MAPSIAASAAQIDAEHVWHPYGAMPAVVAPLLVHSADGVYLETEAGRLVDGMSSWWAAIHGYRHPVLDAAAIDQLGAMSHVMFGGLTHGDTFTPMSVCDPDGGMHAMWTDVLAHQVFVDAPPATYDDRYAQSLQSAIAAHADELAAVIVEPVVQGAGGMRFHDPRYLAVLRQACDEAGVLLIFDEIATGFGRTGALFAADHAGVAPDIMCVGKALTGGYLTLAATLCTTHIAEVISTGEAGGLAHGPTFMGNPLACAIALASVELLLDGPWLQRVAAIETGLRNGLEPLRGAPGVTDVRVLGAIGVVQTDQPVDMAAATAAAVGAGVWLRPFRDLVYTMPPYISTPDDVAAICRGIAAVVAS
jgi:adenosylmethionine-8-amino-7-oxononanoate aminotransferase